MMGMCSGIVQFSDNGRTKMDYPRVVVLDCPKCHQFTEEESVTKHRPIIVTHKREEWHVTLWQNMFCTIVKNYVIHELQKKVIYYLRPGFTGFSAFSPATLGNISSSDFSPYVVTRAFI